MNELAIVAKTSSEETAVGLSSITKKIPVVFFGRLEERKGLCTFIKAIQLLDPELKNKIHITFLGKVVPLYSAELKHLNSQEYIDQELGAQVAYEIISNLYSAEAIQYVKELNCPIVCLTSPQENFPNSALEMGQLPVSLVVSDTGGFRETLQLVNRESGVYWFKPKDADSLVQMLNKALFAYPETPTVCNRATLEKVNNSLLVQKLEYIEQAFNQEIVSESPLPKVTLALTSHNQGKYLIDCLSRIEAQNYKNLEVIVLDDGSTEEYSQEIFEQAQSLFPNYQFIKGETSLGLGAARNYLLDLATGDYFLPLEPQIFLFPFTLEKFATAASHSRAAIINCPRKEVGEVERVVNFLGGTLPTILKANPYGQSCVLFSCTLLKKFRHTESKDIQTQAWEIIAAAVATGEKIVHYPYPLYEYKVTPETLISQEPHPREQYSLRQYLAQIAPVDWSPRQIYMLLTAIQQLQSQPQQNYPAEIEGMRSQILSLESKLLAARKETKKVKKLKAKLAAMESSKFWKFRQKWFRLKQFFRLPTK